MGPVERLSTLFSVTSWYCIEETFETLKIQAKVVELNIPKRNELIQFLTSFPHRDHVVLDVSLDDGDPFSLHSDTNVEQFISDLESLVRVKDPDSKFLINFIIAKSIDSNHRCTIYSLNSLTETLINQTMSGLLLMLIKLLQNRDYIFFDLYEDIEYFNTKTMYFSHGSFELDNNLIERNSQLKKRSEVCNFLNASQYQFVPEDFCLKKRSPNEQFNVLMDMLTGIFALIFISNISHIEGNQLFCTINGYKQIENSITPKSIKKLIADTYYEIYTWIYEGGGLSDKIGLARNVISIHIKNNDLSTLDSGTLPSLRSGYEIYLKKNVEQYIAVKNKLSELIFELSNKTSKKVETFVDSFKKNLLGLFTFFITVFLRGFLSNNTSPVFTKDVSYIELVLLGISLIFLLVSLWEANNDINRIKKEYSRLKTRYSDLLEPNDLDNIFDHDKEHLEDIESATRKITIWALVWLASLIANYLLVCLLGQF